MVISLSFSGVIYQGWCNEVDRFEQAQKIRFQRQLENMNFRGILPLPINDPEIIEETKRRMLTILGMLNGAILVIAGGLGYFLAGRTLLPIQKMVDDQNRFIGDASHELRTPLTSLKTAFEVWLRDKNKTVKDAENIINESVVEVNRLTDLSNSLLYSIKNQSNATQANRGIIQLADVINDSINQFATLAKDKEITITKSVKSLDFKGDKEQLARLFTILLDNAIKYGKEQGWVKISANKADHSVVISVKDNGQGIETKDLPNIFDRFFRADHSRTKNSTNGFGLGLSIAKQIVENHHGSIGVRSQLGHGSTFIVKLPIA